MTAGSTQDVQEDPAVGGLPARVGFLSSLPPSTSTSPTSPGAHDPDATDEDYNDDCACLLCGEEIFCDDCGQPADQLWINPSPELLSPTETVQEGEGFDAEIRRDCGVVLS